MVHAVTFDHRADQCNRPKQNSSTAWLTTTEMTDTMVYRIIFLPSGERARSTSAEGDTGIFASVPAPAAIAHIIGAVRRASWRVMGDLIGGALVLVVVALLGGGLAYMLNSRQQNANLARTPLPAMLDGKDRDVVVKAREYYRLAQQETRFIERLLRDDMVACTIDDDTKQAMRQLVDQFYEM